MPLINGQKMACEPCIRGHRSTKCTHANERLMVPVRKPGRPLSSCPHPSSRACSCAAVTAAIPRKQKCRCGTVQPAPSDGSDDGEAVSSPSKAAFRVHKHGTKPTPTRKPSVDVAGLERMDAGQLNILPSYTLPNGHMAPVPDMTVYQGLNLTPANSSFSPKEPASSIFPYPIQPSVLTSSSIGGQRSPSTNGGSTTARAAPQNGGCCGAATNGHQSRPPPDPTVVNGSSADDKNNGFCATISDPSESGPPPVVPAVVQQPNGPMMAPLQAAMAMQYPYFSQPTIFNYPPQFGSFLQPLQPEQWKQFMAAMSLAQSMAPYAFDMAATGPFAASGPSNGASWTSHRCTCGDACQCVGCAAHPYNEATQNYVRSAWNTVVEDGQKPRADSDGMAKTVDSSTNGSTNGNSSNGCCGPKNITGATTPVTSQTEGTVSPTAPQTPSDGTSGLGEEQTLSANDFFFVSYPFGDSCAGDTASCPCGDDCQCIGCAIHNVPGPEQPAEEGAVPP
ncbi:hypothetical protein XA68_15560 [Ophiocordyceps unilateralis]|uniref:Copper-fist domain-containing protein n=1 Tax=Ophiocordyceps unilateralis TaxID=268505 RepID=A0A2A9P883_OPHUN|nr:hypothetical protein XA68_15560 [Ophiocordyceps unilateralis]